MPITAAVLSGLGTVAAATARYLPMCLLQSSGGGRGSPVRHVTSTSRAGAGPPCVACARGAHHPTPERVASSSRTKSKRATSAAPARDGTNKGNFPGFLVLEIIKDVLLNARRIPTTAARCRAVMTSQGTTSCFLMAALLASRDAVQPLKATNVARGHYDSLPAAQQRHLPAQPFLRGFMGILRQGREGKLTRLASY